MTADPPPTTAPRPERDGFGHKLCRRWRVTTATGQARSVYKALGATQAEIERLFPDCHVEPLA